MSWNENTFILIHLENQVLEKALEVMGDAEFQVAVKKDSEEKDQERKQAERAKLVQMQKDWLEARKRIASLEAQVNMVNN